MSFDATTLARPAIIKMKAYQSARSQTVASDERVYMDANELSLDANPDLARYPDPQPQPLVDFVTRQFGIAAGNLFLGAGVDDAIDALLRVFCEARQDSILITPPTYGYYSVCAAIQDCEVLAAPLKPDTFDLDEDLILRTLTPKTKLVFVCNPNNPTGNSFSAARLLQLASNIGSRAILVVDEAYIEFSSEPSVVREAATASNMVVLRTLSKAWGLAGVRLGAAVAAEPVIQLMHKVRAPYPIARPAVAAAVAELERLTPESMKIRTASVIRQRDRLAARLADLPYVSRVYPSDANFLLIEVRDSAQVMRLCASAGIIVRDRSSELGLANCVRISVGNENENQALIAALQRGVGHG